MRTEFSGVYSRHENGEEMVYGVNWKFEENEQDMDWESDSQAEAAFTQLWQDTVADAPS